MYARGLCGLDELIDNGVESEFVKYLLSEVTLNDTTAMVTLAASQLESAMISLDTGLQKTSVIAALSVIKSLQRHRCGLNLIVIPTQAWHNVSKLVAWTKPNRTVVLDSLKGVDGRLPSYEVLFNTEVDNIIISPKLLFSKDFVNLYVMFLSNSIKSILFDEAHLIATEATQGAHMIKALSERADNVYLLTATPGKSFEQFDYLLDLVGGSESYISLTREDLDIGDNFNVTIEQCYEFLIDDETDKNELNRRARYRNPVESNSEVEYFVTKVVRSNGQSLVYCWYRNMQMNLKNEFESRGLRVAINNADTSSKERDEISRKVRANEVDVVLTTTTEALDIPCDNLFLWQWTSDIIQLVGRLNRSYTSKTINVFFRMFNFESERIREQLYYMIDLYCHQAKSVKLITEIAKGVNECLKCS